MNSDRSAEDFLTDIVEWGNRAQSYIAGMDYDAFLADSKTRDAETKCIEVCGEAANQAGKIDPKIPEQFPEFDIRSAYGMRNVLAHGYYSILPAFSGRRSQSHCRNS